MNKRHFLLTIALMLVPVISATSKSCDKCRDLPNLWRELMEQEFLREWFTAEAAAPNYYSVADMQHAAAMAVGNHFGSSQGGTSNSGGSGNTGGARTYGGAYATDPNSPACGLRDGVTDKPITEQEIRKRECKPVADYVIAHENVHREFCRKAYTNNKQEDLGKVVYVARTEADAYTAGVKNLREYIAKLALQCGWHGSTNKHRNDGRRVVPTKDEIDQLKNNVKSKTSILQRGTK